LRHASLRNVVERVFGVLKSRFPIIKSMPSYAFVTQVCYLCEFTLKVKIVRCIFTMHNFLKINQVTEDRFDREWEENDEQLQQMDHFGDADDNAPSHWRDQLAQDMWCSYQEELARRSSH
jgi:hypothetical protein